MFYDWARSVFTKRIFGADKKNDGMDDSILKHINPQEDIYDAMRFPVGISEISSNALREIIRNEIGTYRLLNYQKQNEERWLQREWHSWQVAYFAKAILHHVCVPIHNKEELFIEPVLELKPDELKLRIDILMYRYNQIVDIKKSRDELNKEFMWSALEVGIMLRYINSFCAHKK